MPMDENQVLESVPVAGVGENDVLDLGGAGGLAGQSAGTLPLSGSRPKPITFSSEQREILLKYFNEYGMTSTHRRNLELMNRCAEEVPTSLDRVKNWIGSEAVKRKRKAGILPRPKIEIAGSSPQPKLVTLPPVKKVKRVNGYNLFFSNCVRSCPEISTDFRVRNGVVAQRWAALTEDERKQWAMKAERICTSAALSPTTPTQPQKGLSQMLSPSALAPEITTEEALVEKTLLAIQEKFDLLEQLGFEGYAVMVNTSVLQTHLLATSKGKAYHKMKQQSGKPLENPFIGYVFSEDLGLNVHLADAPGPSLGATPPTGSPSKRLMTALNSIDIMQKSVMNAFALKYKVATGRSEVPYDNLQSLGVQVYGMPPGIPFHSPLLYNQQQLQQILANLEKVVFVKDARQLGQESAPPLTEVEISTETVASLVASGHELHIGAEEEATQ